MANRVKVLRTLGAGVLPPAGTAADYGRLAVNLTDRKLWVYDNTGAVRLIAARFADHDPSASYRIGDLIVRQRIMYRSISNIGPKAFAAGDWETVSDFRGELLYRLPTQAAQATMTMGGAAISARVVAHPSQSAPLHQWLNSAGVAVAEIKADGYPNSIFGQTVFRVDQVAHSFTAVGQPARFDGTNWVLANANTAAGFASAVVRRVISANAFELQTAGRLDSVANGAFETGSYVANTLYYTSIATPGTLTSVPPPNAASENPVLRTTSGGSAVIDLAFPVGVGNVADQASLLVNQTPNPFTAVGQVAAFDGAEWVLASNATASRFPVGIITATAGNTFTIAFAGEVTSIAAGAAVSFPLVAGAAYYVNTAGLLSGTAPTGAPQGAGPVLWATSGTSGIAMPNLQSPNVLRPNQNLSDVLNVATARTNLGLGTMATQNANAVNISGGTLAGTGSGITAINASNIASGTLADARLTANVALRGAANTFTGAATFTSTAVVIAPEGTATLRIGRRDGTTNVPRIQFNSSGGLPAIADGRIYVSGGTESNFNGVMTLQAASFTMDGPVNAPSFNGNGSGLTSVAAATLPGISITAGDGLSGGGALSASRTLAVDSSVVRTTRTLTAGDGLTGGGTLAANRTFAVDATVVRTTRTLTAGDGLTGGGDLTANRTLAVDSSVVRTTGDQTILGVKTFRQASNATPVLVVERANSVGNAAIGFTTTAGSVFAGQGAAGFFQIGQDSALSSVANRVFSLDVSNGDLRIDGTLTLAAGTTTAQAVRGDRTITTGTGINGGGNLTANRTLSIDIATQAEASAGTSNTKVMTPLRTAQAIAAQTGLREIAAVTVTSGSAILINNLPIGRNLKFVFNGLRNSSTTNASLRVRWSEDNGVSFFNTFRISAVANWELRTLFGFLDVYPEQGMLMPVTSDRFNLSGYFHAPGMAKWDDYSEICNAAEFSWSVNNFASGSGQSARDINKIFVYEVI